MLTHDPIPWLMAQEGPPAVRARRLLGLRSGDVITSIGERKVRGVQSLERLLARQPGQTVPLSYVRGGKEQETTIKL